MIKFLWIVQFISHGQSSSLNVSFEIELDLLNFNRLKIDGGGGEAEGEEWSGGRWMDNGLRIRDY